jgi:Tfp pilus assembly ATPase PilU
MLRRTGLRRGNGHLDEVGVLAQRTAEHRLQAIRCAVRTVHAELLNPGRNIRHNARADAVRDVLRNADSANDLRLQIKLNSQRARTTDLSAGTEHFAIV